MNENTRAKTIIELLFKRVDEFSTEQKIKEVIDEELNKINSEADKLSFLNKLEIQDRKLFIELPDLQKKDIHSLLYKLHVNIQMQIKYARNQICFDKNLSFLMIENEHFERSLQQFDEKLNVTSSFIEKSDFIKAEIKRIKEAFIQPIITTSPNMIPGSLMNYSNYRKHGYEWLSAGQDWPIKKIIESAKSSYLAGGGRLYGDREFDNAIVDNLRDGVSYILYEKFLNEQLTKSESKKVKIENSTKKKRTTIPNKLRALLQQEIKSSCPFCASHEVAHFEIHHIDENPSNNDKANLLMLCPICHSKITKGDITLDEVISMKNKLSQSG